MTTYFSQSDATIATNSMGAITPPSAAELALFRSAALTEWWRATEGVQIGTSSFSWKGRKRSYEMIKNGSGTPSVVANAFKTYTALDVNALKSVKEAVNHSLWPAGASYSIGFIGRQQSAGNSELVSKLGSDYPYIMQESTPRLRVRHRSTLANLIQTTTTWPYATAPFAALLSYDYAAKRLVLRVNGVVEADVTSITQEVVNTDVVKLGNGQVFDAMFFNDALHKDAYAGILSAWDSYSSPRITP